MSVAIAEALLIAVCHPLTVERSLSGDAAPTVPRYTGLPALPRIAADLDRDMGARPGCCQLPVGQPGSANDNGDKWADCLSLTPRGPPQFLPSRSGLNRGDELSDSKGRYLHVYTDQQVKFIPSTQAPTAARRYSWICRENDPTIIVLFGGAGDLVWRKLIPSLFDRLAVLAGHLRDNNLADQQTAMGGGPFEGGQRTRTSRAFPLRRTS
jgi:hypothetical protein